MDAIKNNLTLAGPSLGNDVASFVLSQHTFPPRYGPSQSDDKLSHEEMRRESHPSIHPEDGFGKDKVVWHYCIDHHWYNLLSASSAVLLVSIADFMGPMSRGSIKLQTESYVSVPFGAGGMSVMAEWGEWMLKFGFWDHFFDEFPSSLGGAKRLHVVDMDFSL
ncbi:hypothetical protein NC651_029141 [Populus alba x Populus x berolinensis]|nr:hypothetical protein NC651_029141 [Populus alba x Populus x berolinensis]